MAVEFFLKLCNGIEGESAVEGHAKEIQLMSWSWGAANVSSVAATGGSGAGKVDLSDFSVMTYFDKSTPKLFKSICAGTHLPTGTLTAVKAGAEDKPYLKLDFAEIFITSLQISASGDIPSVSISFSYNQIKMEYFMQGEDGNVTSTGEVTYNTKTNKKS